MTLVMMIGTVLIIVDHKYTLVYLEELQGQRFNYMC